MRLRERTTDPRSQSGMTLIEVLLVVGITGLLVGPLLAWAVLVLREQPVQQDGMLNTAQAGLLRTHFVRDVTTAGFADDYDGGADGRAATWRQECLGGGGQDGRPVLLLVSGVERTSEELTKTIYSVTANGSAEGRSTLWRDRCGAETGELIDSTPVLDSVAGSPGVDNGSPPAVRASCSSPAAVPADGGGDGGDGEAPERCRQVRLQFDAAVGNNGRSDESVELSATRRPDWRSIERDATGNAIPVARLVLDDEQFLNDGTPGRCFVLADRSTDADGDPLASSWELPPAAEVRPADHGTPCSVPDGVETRVIVIRALGEHAARLTVTDPSGARSTAYQRLRVQNRPPTARIVATPDPVEPGQVLELSANESSDPDGAIVRCEWRLTSEQEAAAGFAVEFAPQQGEPENRYCASASWPVPEWAFDGVLVELTVLDDQRSTATAVQFVPILEPVPPPEEPGEPGDPGDPDPGGPDPADPGPGDPDPDPDPPEPGAPVADFVARSVGGNQMRFDASDSSGADLTYRWTFGIGEGQATGQVVTHTFRGAGTYTVTLTVSDGQRSHSRTRTVEVGARTTAPGPGNLRIVDGVARWNAVPGTRRYHIRYTWIASGCARTAQLVIGASENPQRAVPPNPCSADARLTLEVGAERFAGAPELIGWSRYETTVVK